MSGRHITVAEAFRRSLNFKSSPREFGAELSHCNLFIAHTSRVHQHEYHQAAKQRLAAKKFQSGNGTFAAFQMRRSAMLTIATQIDGEALVELIAEVPKAMCEPATLASVLRGSDELADLDAVAQSWFEGDLQVAQMVERAIGRPRKKLAKYLLQSVIPRRRERWTEVVICTALWMREASPEADLCWRELALVAKALADGRDMTEIGLMRSIAVRTIAAHRDAGPT